MITYAPAATATAEATKIPCLDSSLDLFDQELGGFPAGECTLICGGVDTGKTPLGLQFIHSGLVKEEKVALVTSFAPEEILARAAAMELDLDDYLHTSQLILIEQKTQTPGVIGSEDELNHMLTLLEQDLLPWEPTRLVIDSAVPLIGLFQADFRRIAIPTLIRRLNRNGFTTLLTTLMPASSEAMSVRKIIEDLSACSLHLDDQRRPDGQVTRRMTVRKMRGIEPPYPVYETEINSLNRLKLIKRFDVTLDAPKHPAVISSTREPLQPVAKGRTRPIFAEHGASSAKISDAKSRTTGGLKTTLVKPDLANPAPADTQPTASTQAQAKPDSPDKPDIPDEDKKTGGFSFRPKT